MFESIAERFSSTFDKLTRKGVLTDTDVAEAMRDVRLALLEADVSLPVVKSFVRIVQRRATGQNVLRSVSPGQLVIKIVHDELVKVLAGNDQEFGSLKINNPPATVMMVGLQGSGKTTTTAKLAKRLKEINGKRVLVASLDTRRPAAMQQLAILGMQAEAAVFPMSSDLGPVEIARRANRMARDDGHDVLLLDTAGRLHVDESGMDEAEAIRAEVQPRETLLVVDGLTGQDAVNVAGEFDRRLGITGIILTRMEGDGRGGAALSMRSITGKPIRFIGTGEKIDALGDFDPQRIAGRILGMGDIVSLVEKATETFEQEKSERAAKRLMRGRMNFNDLKSQLESIEKMGGLASIATMLPGAGRKLSKQLGQADTGEMKKLVALIDSMTRLERANPHIINASRRKRIATGAGLGVSDLNRLIRMHRMISDIGKKAGRRGGKGLLPNQSMTDMGGKIPDGMQPSAADIANLASKVQSPGFGFRKSGRGR